MPSQRPYFLSSFIAAFRQQPPSLQTSSQQPSKHTTQASSSTSAAASSSGANRHHTSAAASPSSSRTISAAAASQQHHQSSSSSMTVHSPRSGAVPIPNATAGGRRRGSDSSSEGFRDAIGADKWYIGGRTATGEEKFFKLGVVRRVKSNDGLSLDRLSL